MRGRALLAAVVLTGLLVPATAGGQQQVRFAASQDCLTNYACGIGLKSVYHVDISSVLVKLAVAGTGIEALDQGRAEVGIAFSSDPGLSRPDIVSLKDDKHMIGSDHVVPIVRTKVASKYGKRLSRALDGASRALSTLGLRQLNQQVADGQSSQTVADQFIDAHGMGGSGSVDTKRKVTVGYQSFPESKTLAYLYAGALRAAGFNARVKSVVGLRPQMIAAIKAGRIDLYASYSRSLANYLTGRIITASDIRHDLSAALKKNHLKAMALAPATDQDVYVTKDSTAAALGISKISDVVKYWPAAG